MKTGQSIVSLVSTLVLVGGMASGAVAADGQYPSKPVRMIVPFPAGGGTDFIARLVGDKLSDLKDGDEVTIEFAADPSQQKEPINVMRLEKKAM